MFVLMTAVGCLKTKNASFPNFFKGDYEVPIRIDLENNIGIR